jgi:acyl carrier protein
MDVRAALLEAIGEVKGAQVRGHVDAGRNWVDSVDSLDLLEILMEFDVRVGCVTDPADLSASFDSFEAVVERLGSLHALV